MMTDVKKIVGDSKAPSEHTHTYSTSVSKIRIHSIDKHSMRTQVSKLNAYTWSFEERVRLMAPFVDLEIAKKDTGIYV